MFESFYYFCTTKVKAFTIKGEIKTKTEITKTYTT